MKQMVIHMVMLFVLFSGARVADVFAMPDQCGLGPGFTTDASHLAATSNCDENNPFCEQICVSEVRIFSGLYLTEFWSDRVLSIQLETDDQSIRSGFPSSVFHPPQV